MEPQPSTLLIGESSNKEQVSGVSHSSVSVSSLISNPSTSSSGLNSLQRAVPSLTFSPPILSNASFNKKIGDPDVVHGGKLNISSNAFSMPTKVPATNPGMNQGFFATYPPTATIIQSLNPPMQQSLNSGTYLSSSMVDATICTTTAATSATFTTGVTSTHNVQPDQENINPNRVFKRQFDSISMRNTLKRCRANNSAVASSLSNEVDLDLSISAVSFDSKDQSDSSAVIALQSRNSS
ncbi:hypothetical protein CsatB_007004 [Cannabis sativa]